MTVLTNVYSSRNNITSTVVYDDPDLGVVIQHHNPRGRPSVKTQHSVDKSMRNKIQELRNDLSIDSKMKMVLILSFATDEMIKEVQKSRDMVHGCNITRQYSKT
jgi:hypothetical protein